MYAQARIGVVIPALNEELAIGEVLRGLPPWLDRIIVVDNGSTDRTAEIAEECGAEVVFEPRRGYGAACLAGLTALASSGTCGDSPQPPEIVVFIDADCSDDPADLPALLDPLIRDDADMVIGSRVLGNCEPGALTQTQRFGNALSAFLLRRLWKVDCTDLGPFRAMRWPVLLDLRMTDLDYGWTVQMQTRAAARRWRVVEVPVAYRRRIGKSKISGTIRGVIGAGTKILGTIAAQWLVNHPAVCKPSRLIVFTRLPAPGNTKTRLIPALGPKGAAELQREMTLCTLAVADAASSACDCDVEVRSTGGGQREMSIAVGSSRHYVPQGEGDLGSRLARAFRDAFSQGSDRVICIGADCPAITPEILHEAFQALDHSDVVLGPSTDGGYYLIGLRLPALGVFEQVAWGTANVLNETRSRIESLGLTVKTLAPLTDIDEPDDLPHWEQIHREISEGARPLCRKISVIIPTLNEERLIAEAMASARQRVLREPRAGAPAEAAIEIIVADGGSEDQTREIARECGAVVINCAPRGRAAQMNAGAAVATGDVFLFLHADTRLPFDYASCVHRILGRDQVSAGAFQLAFDHVSLPLKTIERAANWRARFRQLPYGDQAIFVLRDTFARLSGYAEMPAMEDFDFIKRLQSHGRIAIASAAVITSARRSHAVGPWRNAIANQLRLLKWRLGIRSDAANPPCEALR